MIQVKNGKMGGIVQKACQVSEVGKLFAEQFNTCQNIYFCYWSPNPTIGTSEVTCV